MARTETSKDAAIHAEAIIAATLASAVMVSRGGAWTQEEAIRQHKLMLNLLRAKGAFDPGGLPD